MAWDTPKDTVDPKQIARGRDIAAKDLAWATTELARHRKDIPRTAEVYIAELPLMRELIQHRRMVSRAAPEEFDTL
jgi:hypothetical protein